MLFNLGILFSVLHNIHSYAQAYRVNAIKILLLCFVYHHRKCAGYNQRENLISSWTSRMHNLDLVLQASILSPCLITSASTGARLPYFLGNWKLPGTECLKSQEFTCCL